MNRSRQHARGSATAAFLLALVLTLLVAATVFAFAAHIFPAPAPITVAAVLVDQQYTRTLYVGGAVFVLAQLGLAFAVFRFRDHGPPARFSRGSMPMEILWTSCRDRFRRSCGLGTKGLGGATATRVRSRMRSKSKLRARNSFLRFATRDRTESSANSTRS